MKSLLLALALLSATALLAPQQESQSGSPTDRPLSQQTVQGCLQGGDHQFTLTDSSGTTYQLQGDAAQVERACGPRNSSRRNSR